VGKEDELDQEEEKEEEEEEEEEGKKSERYPTQRNRRGWRGSRDYSTEAASQHTHSKRHLCSLLHFHSVERVVADSAAAEQSLSKHNHPRPGATRHLSSVRTREKSVCAWERGLRK